MSETTRIPSYCAQCRSRCGCIAEVAGGRLQRIVPMPGHPTGEQLCPKGRAAPELVYHPDRLLTPMRRTTPKGSADPGWQSVGWDAALDLIAGRMRAIAGDGGPEQVAFSVTTPSGTHISDSISWIERLIRAFGSPNTVYGTEICNWHKDVACRFTFGGNIGTPDFAGADCVVLWGNNPAATWLARSVEVNRARKAGARLLVVDPRPTVLARRAHVWLQVRPGTDQALALGLAHLLLQRGDFDQEFVRQWSNGPLLVRADSGRFLRQCDVQAGGSPRVAFARGAGTGELLAYDTTIGRWTPADAAPELEASVMVETLGGPVRCVSAFARYRELAARFPPERVTRLTGVPGDALAAAADLLARPARVAYYAWNGIGQSATATQTDRALNLLYALTGCYGGKGGNVPGEAAAFGDISGNEFLSQAQRGKALGADARPLGPPRQGWITARDMYTAVLERTPYPVRMLMSFGTNLLTSQPDTALAQQALQSLEFHVHADFFVNATAKYADLVLPVATSWEREALRTGFDASLQAMRRVQLRPAVIPPQGQARSDVDIVLALAQRLGLADRFFGLDVDRGHDAVLAGTGVDLAALRASPQGVDLETGVALEAYREPDAAGVARGFATPTRRVEIWSETLLQHGYGALPELDEGDLPVESPDFPLRLSSAKTLAYCHGQHRNLPSLRRLEPDPPLDMPAADAAERGIAAGDWVRVRTPHGHTVARARIVKELPPGTVFAQHGWWEPGAAGTPVDDAHPLAANLNQVIGTGVRDPVSGSIPLRANACQVERLDGGA